MQIKFIPSICKGKSPKYSGHVMVKMPTFDERYRFMGSCGFKMDQGEDGKFMVSGDPMSNIESLRQLVLSSKDFYAEVHIKRNTDGELIESFDMLQLDPDCDPLLIEVATGLMTGFRAGKR